MKLVDFKTAANSGKRFRAVNNGEASSWYNISVDSRVCIGDSFYTSIKLYMLDDLYEVEEKIITITEEEFDAKCGFLGIYGTENITKLKKDIGF